MTIQFVHILFAKTYFAKTYAAVSRVNGDVIRTHVTASHVAVLVEFPMLIAMSAIPLSRFRMLPFVFKAH